MSDAAADVARLAGMIEELSPKVVRDLGALHQQVYQLNGTLEAMKATVGGLNEQMTDVDGRAREFEAFMARIDVRISGMVDTMGKLSNRVEGTPTPAECQKCRQDVSVLISRSHGEDGAREASTKSWHRWLAVGSLIIAALSLGVSYEALQVKRAEAQRVIQLPPTVR